MKKILFMIMGIALGSTYSLSASPIVGGEHEIDNFSIIDSTVTIIVTTFPEEEYGNVVVPKGEISVLVGDTITITAIADSSCFNFEKWRLTIDNGVADKFENPYTFVVEKTCSLIANFTHKITLSTNPEGSGTVSGGGNNIAHGKKTVTASANDCFQFINWTENGEVVSTNSEFLIDADCHRNLVANFEKISYNVTVTVNNSDYGKAQITDTIFSEYGCNSVTVTAYPLSSYFFVNWTINDSIVSTNNPYTFEIKKDVTIQGNFYGLDFDTCVNTICCNNNLSCCNCFMLNIKKIAEYGYEVRECKWFKDDNPITDPLAYNEFSYSAGPNPTDYLAPADYSFEITTTEGIKVCSSQKKIDFCVSPKSCISDSNSIENLIVYPNPVMSGNPFTIDGIVKDTHIEVYNYLGMLLYNTTATNSITTLTLDVPQGIYLIRTPLKCLKIMILK